MMWVVLANSIGGKPTNKGISKLEDAKGYLLTVSSRPGLGCNDLFRITLCPRMPVVLCQDYKMFSVSGIDTQYILLYFYISFAFS